MHAKILKLTREWYEYVTLNHHKNRDLYWYIETTYSPDGVTYTPYHNGYVAHDLRGKDCKTYDDAREELLNLLKKAINGEKGWVDRVLEAKPDEYDELQVEQAHKWCELWGDGVD